jgi:hypothetical protein
VSGDVGGAQRFGGGEQDGLDRANIVGAAHRMARLTSIGANGSV